MKRRKLLWKVYPYYFIIIVISLVLTALYASHEIHRTYVDEITRTLEVRARLVDRQLRHLLLESDTTVLDRQCKELGRLSNTRITVVDADGVVLGDSDEDPQSMENHGNRPEIMRAYTGEVGVETRFSNTLQRTMMYVAVPVEENGEIVGVVRTSYAVTTVKQTLGALYGKFVVSGIIITIIATIVSLVVFRQLTRPLKELQEGAERFARGDLALKLPVPDTEEIAALAKSMNRMAAELDARIRTIVQERNERETILASMSEGILALDTHEKIVTLNRMAADFLGLHLEQAPGKLIHEVVRIADLHDFIEKCFSSHNVVEMEITLPGKTERCLQVRGTVLNDVSGNCAGVVLVFSDITRMKKLENIRRDFVANVSHELKTPITAITASVETLLDDDGDSQQNNRRFLEMIARHADRLNSLVEDLLSLARLEAESERGDVNLTRNRLTDILESSVQACREQSIHYNTTITLTCGSDLEANLNPVQLEQAVTNLIDNAIKYSDAGATVSVDASISGDEIIISVQDQGCGIEEKHLPRLFERFYQVDKARSRKAGGTGLGLAIVKHVALAHGGRVSVDSSPGVGSAFRIHIPRTK
ncbi:MAG: PAS domain-containing protein [candidate division Zixibacteria bacterium]|nr:PAS domain-containing protein [candidate division Zixibacteria bacterium]